MQLKKNNEIALYFYYDEEPSEEELELASEAETSVIADCSEPYSITYFTEVIKYPLRINYPGYLIYSRYENDSKNQNRSEIKLNINDIMNIANLRLSAMKSLLGVITPNVRKVSVEEEQNNILLYFYYDKEPSLEEFELAQEAATRMRSNSSDLYFIMNKLEVVNYPKKINFDGYLIYARCEELI